jgi:hypothetical protein
MKARLTIFGNKGCSTVSDRVAYSGMQLPHIVAKAGEPSLVVLNQFDFE